jgi:hypothetical protein
MAKVVVVGGIVKCIHGGQLRLISGDSRLDVDGNAAVVQGQEAGLSFAPATLGLISPCTYAPGGVSSPCAIVVPATAGISTKLTVGGLGVLLDTAEGQTSNATSWSIQDAGQNKLELDG